MRRSCKLLAISYEPGNLPRCRVAASPRRSAFSLVELLTVVGIIALLISILLPALSSARTEAKRGATKSLIGSLERGLEVFNTDFGKYPNSTYRADPVKYGNESKQVFLSGAHWLARAMVGPDSNGPDYAGRSLDDAPASCAYTTDIEDDDDFSKRDGYTGVCSQRRKPYVEKVTIGKDTDSDSIRRAPNTGRFILNDTFDFPILYYRANPRAQYPFCVDGLGTTNVPNGKPNDLPGIYNQYDNHEITGGQLASNLSPGWDFAGSGSLVTPHGLAQSGFGLTNGRPELVTAKVTDTRLKGFTFAGTLYNANAFKASTAGGTGQGVLKPVNDSSFVLLSPGPDGIFGTTDDVANFK